MNVDRNHYEEDDYAKASEYLRLALAFLGQYKIPPSPFNFRLGYEQVSGRNATLGASLQKMAAASGNISAEQLWELYRENYLWDHEGFARMRDELRSIILNVQSQFQTSGDRLSVYADTLTHFSEVLEQPTSAAQMTREVRKVIDDTQSVQQSQRLMEQELSHMSKEVELLKRELQQVKEESMSDALTGIANRKAFDRDLQAVFGEAAQGNKTFSLLLVDIDYFKKFNDTYGHLIGDKVLRFVATALNRGVESEDLCARYGGEEFAILLKGASLNVARNTAEKLRQIVSSRALKDSSNNNEYGKITVSIGVAQYKRGEDSDELIARADTALYSAKQQGRNRVALSDPANLVKAV